MYLTHAEKIKRIKDLAKMWEKDTPEVAIKRLIEEGILTESGQLAPEYGGPPRSDEDDRS